MFTLQHISYLNHDGELLFDQLDLTIQSSHKIALVGNNGTGKSTLLKIIAGEIQTSYGQVSLSSKPYYVPQHFGQFSDLTIAEAIGVEGKLRGLKAILAGDGSEENFTLLEDDWTIEERCLEALSHWGLQGFDLEDKLSALSGGEKTKVFLSGIEIHDPQIILLDEPSNHLDNIGRELLYELLEISKATVLVVSHDRQLLNLLDTTFELSRKGIRSYGGNYDFYIAQKRQEQEALMEDLDHQEKELRKAKSIEREAIQRQQKLDARGKKKQEKSGVSRIMMNTLRNKAENSTAKAKDVHAEKITGISGELQNLRTSLASHAQIKFGFSGTPLHKGKVLFRADHLNHHYNKNRLWDGELNFQINSGDRIALEGTNGSGKTTLIKILLGQLSPTEGKVWSAGPNSIYVDQEYSLIDDSLTVYEQARMFNSELLEHEIKIRLDRFLFPKQSWDKPCALLSGGEKMRLLLCCLTIQQKTPDLIVLDEPTNNLDLQSLSVLTEAISQYEGTLLVVSHDVGFLKEIGCRTSIFLS